MSTQQAGQEIDSEKYQSIGAKVAKQLSKRMSLSKSSKQSSSKEASTKESSSKSNTADGGFGQTATTESTTKDTADESNFSKQVVDNGGELKDQGSKGDMSGVQGMAGKEENTKNALGERDAAGAVSGLDHKPSINPNESNDDIRRGPVTHGRTNQRDTTGGGFSGAGGSGEGGISQSGGGTAAGGTGGHLAFAGSNTSKGDSSAGGMTGDSTAASKTGKSYSTGETTSAANPTGSKGLKDSVGDSKTGSSATKDSTHGGTTTGGAYTGSKASKSTTTGGKPAFNDTAWGTGTGGAVAGGTLAGNSAPKGTIPGTKHSYADASKTTGAGDTVTGGAFDGSKNSNDTASKAAKAAYGGTAKEGTIGNQATQSNNAGVTSSGGGLSRSNATKGKSGNGMTGSDMSTSEAIDNRFNGGTAAGGTAIGGLTGMKAGQSATDDTINHELSEQSHIGQDVFSSGASNKDAAKGLSGGEGMMSHELPSKNMSNIGTHKKAQQTSQPSEGTLDQRPTSAGQDNKGMSGNSGLGMGAVGGGALAGGATESSSIRRDMTKGETARSSYNQGSYTQAQSSTATTATTGMTSTTSSVQPRRVVQNLSGGGNKVTVLQDKVQAVSQKCKTQLGLSATEISQRGPTVDTFFDAVAAERLRWMPPDGSRLDCSLRWASRLAYAVDALRQSIGAFAPGADEAAKLIWGFEILLLEVRETSSRLLYSQY